MTTRVLRNCPTSENKTRCDVQVIGKLREAINVMERALDTRALVIAVRSNELREARFSGFLAHVKAAKDERGKAVDVGSLAPDPAVGGGATDPGHETFPRKLA